MDGNTKVQGLMQRTIRPERVMALGFLLLIGLGTVLLSLPIAAVDGKSIGLGNGLFTATSAVCVTGLVTVDTGTTFSLFGQIVLMCLFQVGGLGFMIFTTLVMAALGRRISLKDRVLIRDAMSASTLSGLVQLTAWYSLLALGIEAVGAIAFATRLIPRFGWSRGIWYSVWHAVSAFCNAGFDLMGGFRSLTVFADDPVMLLAASMLILMGGIGFAVILDVLHSRFRVGDFNLHTRITLVMTGVLLLSGMAFYALVEWSRPETLGSLSAGKKLLNAFFQSVTMRTAGFNSVPLDQLHDSSKLVSILLMLVGASSASTGGGVKVTTVAVLLLAVISVLKGEEDICASKRRLPALLVRRALAIILFYIVILLCGTVIISLIEGDRFSMVDLLFETASALATVGVSSIGTPNLKPASQCVLVPIMYIGRIGPLTMALALANRQGKAKSKLRYPEETIIIG